MRKWFLRKIQKLINQSIMKKIGRARPLKSSNKKVLFAYSFTWYENCRYHDYLLAQSLRLRGAEIIPVVCGGIQKIQNIECTKNEGFWQVDSPDNQCNECKRREWETWNKWGGMKTIDAAKMVLDEDIEEINIIIRDFDIEDYKEWSYMEAPVGKWCFDSYRNNFLVTEIELDNQFKRKMLAYAKSICLLLKVTERIVLNEKPDIIYSNDSFYNPGSVMEFLGRKYRIPFYNGYAVGRINTYSYAKDEPVLSLNLEKLWNNYKEKSLKKDEETFIREYLANRHLGLDMHINAANPAMSIKEIKSTSIYGEIRKNKPTALLATNVTWDAAALNRDNIYSGLIECVLHTVDYFKQHDEWQLIIRPHPAEVGDKVPEAQERIAQIILKHFNYKLPSNIVIIDSDAVMSIYELYPIADIGIVYTSTVGLEIASLGKPVIPVGEAHFGKKGFTYDPEDKNHYLELINKLLSQGISSEESKKIGELARKYFYLYYFKYMFPVKWYSYIYLGNVKLHIRSYEELLPGQDKYVDYICDAILNGKEIFGPRRMPP